MLTSQSKLLLSELPIDAALGGATRSSAQFGGDRSLTSAASSGIHWSWLTCSTTKARCQTAAHTSRHQSAAETNLVDQLLCDGVHVLI
jgi:hypothetical protein